MEKKQKPAVSIQALHRMPYYLQFIKDRRHAGETLITAKSVATELRLNEVQVRKDLAAISSSKGRPNTGFVIADLIHNMEEYLGFNDQVDAILVGTGSLGRAFLSYDGFTSFGLSIVAAFDKNPVLIGKEISGRKVYGLEDLQSVCSRLNARIGIIAVPVEEAQSVCDQLLDCGILAVWNFAPVHLNAPEHILVQNENMAASLAILSRRLRLAKRENI